MKKTNKQKKQTQNEKLIDEMFECLKDAPPEKYLQKYFRIKIIQFKTKMLHSIFEKKFGSLEVDFINV